MPPLALIGGYVPTNPPPIALRKVGTKKLPKLGNLGRPPRGLPKLVNLGRPLGPKKFPTRPTWTSFGLLEITHLHLGSPLPSPAGAGRVALLLGKYNVQ